MADWKKVALAAGGAVGVAAVIYYLREEKSVPGKPPVEPNVREKKPAKPAIKVEEVTKEQVKQILEETATAQGQMKKRMMDLTDDVFKHKLTLEPKVCLQKTYEKVVKAMQPKDSHGVMHPQDPVEKHGLSMADFDRLLAKYQNDPGVQGAIASMKGAPNPSCGSAANKITVEQIIEVYNLMLKQLEELFSDFQALPNKSSFDRKFVTMAAQAIVGAKIEKDKKISSKDLESAVQINHTTLAAHPEFASVNINIQRTTAKLMGTK